MEQQPQQLSQGLDTLCSQACTAAQLNEAAPGIYTHVCMKHFGLSLAGLYFFDLFLSTGFGDL